MSSEPVSNRHADDDVVDDLGAAEFDDAVGDVFRAAMHRNDHSAGQRGRQDQPATETREHESFSCSRFNLACLCLEDRIGGWSSPHADGRRRVAAIGLTRRLQHDSPRQGRSFVRRHRDRAIGAVYDDGGVEPFAARHVR